MATDTLVLAAPPQTSFSPGEPPRAWPGQPCPLGGSGGGSGRQTDAFLTPSKRKTESTAAPPTSPAWGLREASEREDSYCPGQNYLQNDDFTPPGLCRQQQATTLPAELNWSSSGCAFQNSEQPVNPPQAHSSGYQKRSRKRSP